MKKIFTLATTLFVAMSMNAQNFTEEVVVNTDLSGDEETNVWVHEFRLDEEGVPSTTQTSGPAIIEDGVAKVYVRSYEQAVEAGNPTLVNANNEASLENFADWDSQFFITWPEDKAAKVGDKIKLKMRIKGDAEQVAATQSHKGPGEWISSYVVGDVNITTDWTEFESAEVPVIDGQENGKAAAGIHTIAFNLGKGAANTVYFDDIQVIIYRTDYVPEFDENELALSFVSFEWPEGEHHQGASRQDEDGNYVVYVRSKEQAMEAGNATMDGDNLASWDSQFFITWPEEYALIAGDKVQVTMDIKADVEAKYGTQCHRNPGQYHHWYCIDDVTFKTDWATYTKEVTVSDGDDWGKMKTGTHTIAFNLATGIENTLYFKNVHVKLIREVVEEFTYDPENNPRLHVSNGEAGENSWDRQAICTLNASLEEGKTYTVKATIMAEEGGECQLVPIYSTSENVNEWGGSNDVQYLAAKQLSSTYKEYTWTFQASFPIDKLQFFIGKIGGDIYFDDVSCVEDGTESDFVDNGNFDSEDISNWAIIEWAGQTMERIGDGTETPTSIRTANVSNQDNIIYDLQGRRVENPVKGLYINNGKKVIIK